jgi:ABC-type nitrate/sulfonate/bicarbonate transport system permease component
MLGALPGYLTSPGAIVQSFLVEVRSGDLLQHIQASMSRIVVGYAIGATVGVMLGLLSGTSRLLESFFDPLVAIAYPVPKIIFLPIFMVWVGIGDPSKVLTIATSVFFPVFINAYQGARSVQRPLIWAGRNMGASRWKLFWGVVFPAASPQIFVGLRVANAVAFVIMFSAEIVSSRSGLGYMIVFAEQFNRYDQIFVAIGVIALLGFLSDRLIVAVRRRVLCYLPEVQEAYG